MSDLADQVLPLIRTRAELYWRAASEHGYQMHNAIDILEHEAPANDPAEFYAVTHKALASAVKVIARADDSSGVIGDACRRLLAIHPVAAVRAGVSPTTLVKWMITFQFGDGPHFFEIDPAAYAPALGPKGLAAYRRRLDEIRADIGPEQPTESGLAPNWVERSVLSWNDRRLAVFDRDVDAIIRTHARDRRVAMWLLDTARAFEEINDIGRAIDWAQQAVDFNQDHQSRLAADYWCALLEQHRPGELQAAWAGVFRRWPSASTADGLHAAAGLDWPDHHDEVERGLAHSAREAVLFAMDTLEDPRYAWERAHTLELRDADVWESLSRVYEKVDPLATLPVLTMLVESELTQTGAPHYKVAARRLTRMRRLAAGTELAPEIDTFIAELRDTHRRRPRLQQELDRAHLP